MLDLDFYKGKRVFLTGHTGFKGAWLCRILALSGAHVTGYALPANTEPSLYALADIEKDVRSVIGDVRDFDSLKKAFLGARPEIAIHMAAQPLVRESYKNPRYTYETNVMGTVNVLECVRESDCVRSFLNVTTDKVYLNRERQEGYREDEPLDGFDPYSNSKSCSELATHSYRRSFFSDGQVAISTARAGNVIGGGDFATDRIIPDCVRAAAAGEPIVVRNPRSVRPFQHVLEPLFAYLMIAAAQYRDVKFAGYYNVGPDGTDCIETGALVDTFICKWERAFAPCKIERIDKGDSGPHEAGLLKLDNSLIKNTFDWKPRWSIDEAVEKTVEWCKVWLGGGDIRAEMDREIEEYIS